MKRRLLVCSLLLIFVTPLGVTIGNAANKVYSDWKVEIYSVMGGRLYLSQKRNFTDASLSCEIAVTQKTAKFRMENSSPQGLGVRRIRAYFDEVRDLPHSQTLESRFVKFCGATPPLNIKDYNPSADTNW